MHAISVKEYGCVLPLFKEGTANRRSFALFNNYKGTQADVQKLLHMYAHALNLNASYASPGVGLYDIG